VTETKTEHLSDVELALFKTHPHVRASLEQFDADFVNAVMGLLATVPETGRQVPAGQSAALLVELEKENDNGK
jgi:hypothetical protein